jgi:DNA replicative helicase MCM subunit Mcm2 (Cdc46/Mcm family)
VPLPCLQPEAYVSKLVIVPGIVTAASRPKHKATYVTIQCKDCRWVASLNASLAYYPPPSVV